MVDFSDTVIGAMKKSNLLVTETSTVKNQDLEGLGDEYANNLSEGDFEKINELSNFHSIETSFAIKLKPSQGFYFSSPKANESF